MTLRLRIAQHPDADALLSRDSLALLIGMLLDQQVTMEKAFRGPYELRQRLGRELSATEIADMDPDDLVELFSRPPAVHRFPGAMAKRVHILCRHLKDHYAGEATAVWHGAGTGDELLARLRALPGFGEQKAKIFLALLGKQCNVRPDGWREAAGLYGEEGALRSAADITGPESLAAVREHKRELKQAAAATGQKKRSTTASSVPTGSRS